MTNRDDEKTILVRVHTPDEGYHDVCDELIFSDFEENPKAFKCTLAGDYISCTSAEWKAMERVTALAELYCRTTTGGFVAQDVFADLKDALTELDRIRGDL